MKIKNKKTGEMGIINYFDNQSIVIYPIDENWDAKGDKKYVYNSLAELNEDWQDYEEPKEYWYIYADKPQRADCGDILEEDFKAIGNYFETKEEAEKAVEKLKAWKRLKDKGFEFNGWIREHKKGSADITIASFIDEDFDITDELYLLFGGKNEPS